MRTLRPMKQQPHSNSVPHLIRLRCLPRNYRYFNRQKAENTQNPPDTAYLICTILAMFSARKMSPNTANSWEKPQKSAWIVPLFIMNQVYTSDDILSHAKSRLTAKAFDSRVLESQWVWINNCLGPNIPVKLIHNRYSGSLHEPLKSNKFEFLGMVQIGQISGNMDLRMVALFLELCHPQAALEAATRDWTRPIFE